MRRALLIVTAGVAAIALALPLFATAKKGGNKPPGTGNLTIVPSAKQIKFGRSVTITGTLKGSNNDNVTIELQHDPYPFGTTYAPLDTTKTNSKGEYSFTTRPTKNENYRTVAQTTPEARSDNLTIGVKVRVTRTVDDFTPDRGQPVTISGTVVPAHDGRTVYLQRRRKNGTWRTVATTTLQDAGADRPTTSVYSRRIRIYRDGLWRARVRTHGDHIGNKSRRLRLDVP